MQDHRKHNQSLSLLNEQMIKSKNINVASPLKIVTSKQMQVTAG